MKFRATTNSIRIRVRKSDLEQLTTTGKIYEEVSFPGGDKWSYGLLINGDDLTARMKDNTIIISIPKAAAMAWINSNEVGIEHHLPLDSNEKLHLLIEKDFPCKTREEDLADTFFELDEGAC
jgi:hypothetical protein